MEMVNKTVGNIVDDDSQLKSFKSFLRASKLGNMIIQYVVDKWKRNTDSLSCIVALVFDFVSSFQRDFIQSLSLTIQNVHCYTAFDKHDSNAFNKTNKRKHKYA